MSLSAIVLFIVIVLSSSSDCFVMRMSGLLVAVRRRNSNGLLPFVGLYMPSSLSSTTTTTTLIHSTRSYSWSRMYMVASSFSSSSNFSSVGHPSNSCPFHSNNQNQDFVKHNSQQQQPQENSPTITQDQQQEQSPYEPSDQFITQRTMNWVQNVIIRYNLCPFADSSFRSNQIYTCIVRGQEEEEIMSAVLYQSILRKDDTGTTLVVCPEYSTHNLEEFLHLVDIVQQVLEDYQLQGDIQIVPFHPLFEFQGSGKNGMDNFTNRSPYPTIHILREEEVSMAVEKLNGDASKVWKRNVSLLTTMEEELGREKAERALQGEMVEGMVEILRNIKSMDNKEKKRNE